MANHILIVSHEIVGERMAGPGIRYYHLARALSREFDVVLAAPHPVPPQVQADTMRIVAYTPREWNSLEPLVRAAQVVVLPGILANDFASLGECAAAIVIDGYDPYLAEWLSAGQANPQLRETQWESFARSLMDQHWLGDFFICASERQRDWWLGLLEAHGRINAFTFAEDPTLRRLIDVVPFGLPAAPPRHTRRVIKEVWQGVGDNDRVVLWGGGLWLWLDPFTAIRAIGKVWQPRQDIRLVFPGARHPNPVMAEMPTHADAARALADDLGLLDRAIFFGDWVPYADWQNVLLESDLALTLHARDTFETRLAFRSRVLDYIWAGVPILAARGDATSELIEQHQLGETVECGDVDGVAQAIVSLLETPREAFVERFARARAALTWERVAQPLIEFCRHPRRAPDRMALGEQLGNPVYRQANERLRGEIARLNELVKAYERRRAVRLANCLAHARHRK